MKYYFVRTNAYDMILVDDGNTRYAFVDCNDCPIFAGYDKPDMFENAKNTLVAIADDIDVTNAGWTAIEETADEIIADCEVLAEFEDVE